MHHTLRVIGVFALFVATLVASGCSSGRQPIRAGSGNVYLTVWRVLAPNIDDPESLYNRGCRLSDEDIRNYVYELQQSASIYGENVWFTWAGETINNITDLELGQLAGRTQDRARWRSPDFLLWDSGNFNDPESINIYFVGNVQATGSQSLAATFDPFAANTAGVPPWIIVNDCGFSESYGIDPTTTPSHMRAWHVLQHEVTHYFARFRNRTFGVAPNSRTYDDGEHVPAGSNNILSPFTPFPLVIPGNASDGSTELGEISNRIDEGRWNLP